MFVCVVLVREYIIFSLWIVQKKDILKEVITYSQPEKKKERTKTWKEELWKENVKRMKKEKSILIVGKKIKIS